MRGREGERRGREGEGGRSEGERGGGGGKAWERERGRPDHVLPPPPQNTHTTRHAPFPRPRRSQRGIAPRLRAERPPATLSESPPRMQNSRLAARGRRLTTASVSPSQSESRGRRMVSRPPSRRSRARRAGPGRWVTLKPGGSADPPGPAIPGRGTGRARPAAGGGSARWPDSESASPPPDGPVGGGAGPTRRVGPRRRRRRLPSRPPGDSDDVGRAPAGTETCRPGPGSESGPPAPAASEGRQRVGPMGGRGGPGKCLTSQVQVPRSVAGPAGPGGPGGGHGHSATRRPQPALTGAATPA